MVTVKTVYLKIMWRLERMKRTKSQNQRVMKILSLIMLIGRTHRPSNLEHRETTLFLIHFKYRSSVTFEYFLKLQNFEKNIL